MLARLGIIATVLVTAIALWVGGYCTAAKWVVLLSGLLVVETTMFRYYTFSHLNIKVGKSKDVQLIKGDDTHSYELLCVPISIRVTWWEVKGISFVVKSNSDYANAELFNKRGISLEGIDGTCTLDWRIKRGFASLTFLSGQFVFIGNPTIPHALPLRESYPIKLEVWHSDDLITQLYYVLTVIDGRMNLSDDVQKYQSQASNQESL